MTDQNYKELVQIYADYAKDGLEILAYPCNQFHNQEPGSADDIIEFQAKYGVTFPVVEKSRVNDDEGKIDTDPAWQFMRDSSAGPAIMGGFDIEWNFHKFLINSDGQVAFSYNPNRNPLSLRDDIESLLY